MAEPARVLEPSHEVAVWRLNALLALVGVVLVVAIVLVDRARRTTDELAPVPRERRRRRVADGRREGTASTSADSGEPSAAPPLQAPPGAPTSDEGAETPSDPPGDVLEGDAGDGGPPE